MIKKRILRLADAIEDGIRLDEEPVIFSMACYYDKGRTTMVGHHYETECGTYCCIGGHAVLLFGSPEDIAEMLSFPIAMTKRIARRLLRLTDPEADLLLMPCLPEVASYTSGDPQDKRYIDSVRAADQLRHFATHGKVDWSATLGRHTGIQRQREILLERDS